jgi:hypothetical protein
MNITDHISESLEIFDADADLGIFLTLDLGRKKFESGINIPDPQHC